MNSNRGREREREQESTECSGSHSVDRCFPKQMKIMKSCMLNNRVDNNNFPVS